MHATIDEVASISGRMLFAYKQGSPRKSMENETAVAIAGFASAASALTAWYAAVRSSKNADLSALEAKTKNLFDANAQLMASYTAWIRTLQEENQRLVRSNLDLSNRVQDQENNITGPSIAK